jgi:hypothetical protein
MAVLVGKSVLVEISNAVAPITLGGPPCMK